MIKLNGLKYKHTGNKLREAFQESKKAMQELKQEQFNSEMLDTLFYNPAYRTNEPGKCIVQSRNSGEPVMLNLALKHDKEPFRTDYYYLTIDGDGERHCLGDKNFRTQKKLFGKKMMSGSMSSTGHKKYKGLGIREDEFQIKFAFKNGIKSIPREARSYALWYHLKMGFTPVPELIRIHSAEELYKELKNAQEEVTGAVPNMLNCEWTPIIKRKKGIFGYKYFFDKNSSKALAALRTDKQQPISSLQSNYSFSPLIPMELSGKNLKIWKNMIHGVPKYKNV